MKYLNQEEGLCGAVSAWRPLRGSFCLATPAGQFLLGNPCGAVSVWEALGPIWRAFGRAWGPLEHFCEALVPSGGLLAGLGAL